MATLFPPPSAVNAVQQSPQQLQNQNVGGKLRSYTPYVFQPNFLKQQMRQRRERFAGPMGFNSGMGPPVPNSLHMNHESGKFEPVASHQPMMGNNPSHMGGSKFLSSTSATIDDAQKKKSGRRVIDWTSSCALYLESRKYERYIVDVPEMLPDSSFTMEMQSVAAYKENPVTSITSKFIRSATNKMKCPVYKVVWTPDGRRLVTGSASGEFTLWNGTAFNFETILQAHDCPVRAMAWSKHDNWLITGDNQGYIKYWQLNMNNVKMYQAHKDQACRSVSFGPTDHKFTTASDDGTVRVWDFLRCHEERILRGHGADVKQVDWHPYKGLILSASKDLHTPVKLWDPRSGQSLATIHAHKGTVMDVKWNQNGNWFLSASRDHLIKLYDVRNLKQEMQIFRGHKKEAFSVAWHPIHEDLFASGGSEGSILFWQVGEEKEAGALEGAHESLIWSLAWHPLGHVLVSGSNDHSTKFWARNRPGDSMRDRYNLVLLPHHNEETSTSTMAATSSTQENEDKIAEAPIIPGMGDADVAAAEVAKRDEEEQKSGIPGLDWSYEEKNEFERKISAQYDRKKIPYARPVPRAFVAAWEANKEGPPPDRPRSPYRHDRDDFNHRHRRPYDRPPFDDDRPPREFMRGRHNGPYRRFPNGPGGRRHPKSPERTDDDDDDKIYVDGVEVGPDFQPEDVKEDRKFEPNESDMRPSIGSGPDVPRGRGRRGEGPFNRGPRPERPMGRGREIENRPGGMLGPRGFPDRIRHDDFPPDVFPGPDSNFTNEMDELPPRFSNSETNSFPEDYGLPMDDVLEQEMYFAENGEPLDQIGPPLERMNSMHSRFQSDRGPSRPRGGMGRGARGRGDMRGRGFPLNREQQGWGQRGRRSPPRMRRGMRPSR